MVAAPQKGRKRRMKGSLGKLLSYIFGCVCCSPEKQQREAETNFPQKSAAYGYGDCLFPEKLGAAWEDGTSNRPPAPFAGEIWKSHYCSLHRILLVGEGDFSFTASLATTFGSAFTIIASSLDSQDFLRKNYRRAMANIQELSSRGCLVLHGVDATQMAMGPPLRGQEFDRIIFNFAHSGFFPDESSESQICRHQKLIRLFLKNAKKLIAQDGEVHITHKTNGFHLKWDLEGLATSVGLELIEEVPFDFSDFPGYRTKYGFGGNNNFHSKPSSTYKFGLPA